MALNQFTTQDIDNLISSQLETSFNQALSPLPKSFCRALSRVFSAVFILLYKYAGFIFLQMFIDHATYDEITINGKKVRPLKLWGDLIGEPPLTDATQAVLDVDISVLDIGSTLLSGAQLVHAQTGLLFLSLDSVVLTANPFSIRVRASSDPSGGDGAGTIGNLSIGDTLVFASPLSFVGREVTVTGSDVIGDDAEPVETYRERIKNRFQKKPQGGAYADYELWGLDVAGIVNIYPYRGSPGEVDVYVEDNSVDGIPDLSKLDLVYDAIQKDSDGRATRRPVGALVNMFPITRTGFVVVVSGISGVDDLAQVQADILSAITVFMREREPYIDGLTIPPRKDKIPRSALIGICEDIVTAANGVFDTVHYHTASSLVDLEIYALGTGEKAKLYSLAFS